jgi:hypothetical protein
VEQSIVVVDAFDENFVWLQLQSKAGIEPNLIMKTDSENQDNTHLPMRIS